MNVKERLKQAYENVLYNADTTWTNTPNAYQEANLELCLTEQQIQNDKLTKVRPRTVRDSIPLSRLAQYSNYEYNESREMSYTCNFPNYADVASSTAPTEVEQKEVWQTAEVDELYKWFTTDRPEDKCSRLEFRSYESPLLKVNGFEDRILKYQITGDRVRNIWSDEKLDKGNIRKSYDMFINLYMTPIKNFYLIPKTMSVHTNQYKERNISDFEQIKQLSKLALRETEGISRYLKEGTFEIVPPVADSGSTEILYSEVLQGLAPGKKQTSSSIKIDHTKGFSGNKFVGEPKVSPTTAKDNSFMNYTVLNSQRPSLITEESIKRRYEESAFIKPKPDQVRYLQNNVPKVVQNFPQLPEKPDETKFVGGNSHVRAGPPSFSAQQDNLNVQTFSRYRYPSHNQCFIDRQTRNAFIHPFSTSCVQQAYFYSPMPPVQRWLHPNFPSTCYPTQIFTSSWITQNQIMPQSYDVNRIFGATAAAPGKINSERNDVPAGKGNSFISRVEVSAEDEFTKEVVEIESMVTEHQVSTSASEELEIQALEQYSNSNESVYQDLEKEAAEQYGSSSD